MGVYKWIAPLMSGFLLGSHSSGHFSPGSPRKRKRQDDFLWFFLVGDGGPGERSACDNNMVPWTARLDLITVRTFLRALGAVYFVAFLSLGMQAAGLIGSHGILPFAEYFQMAHQALGAKAYWSLPSLLWLAPTDAGLYAAWIAGCVAAAIVIAGLWQRAALAVCLLLWLSLCSAGQDFLSFQWDILLCEVGFLATIADTSRVRIGLFRWLLFRLMFFSGAVKLLSRDPAWRSLDALKYHYFTQPLPTPLAWYAQQLPGWFQRFSVAMVFAVELIVPFFFFAPRRFRHIAAASTMLLQINILLTGNYTFFNWLTIALCLWLFIEPKEPAPTRSHRAVSIAVASLVGILSLLVCLQLFSVPLPASAETLLQTADPLRIVNSYGLFAVMTTTREEIVIEGSDDAVHWLPYEFRYKPGDVHRAPPIVAPLQPRLDWQMWFAALGSVQGNGWFVHLVERLIQGEPAVLRLLAKNPFPKAPPKYVRARTYTYTFTRPGEGGWWKRQESGEYLPTVSMR